MLQRELQSRRQVQRRFPPGALVVSEWNGKLIGMVIGWAPNRDGRWYDREGGRTSKVSTWEALVLTPNSRLEFFNWERIRAQLTLEEWEAL